MDSNRKAGACTGPAVDLRCSGAQRRRSVHCAGAWTRLRVTRHLRDVGVAKSGRVRLYLHQSEPHMPTTCTLLTFHPRRCATRACSAKRTAPRRPSQAPRRSPQHRVYLAKTPQVDTAGVNTPSLHKCARRVHTPISLALAIAGCIRASAPAQQQLKQVRALTYLTRSPAFYPAPSMSLR